MSFSQGTIVMSTLLGANTDTTIYDTEIAQKTANYHVNVNLGLGGYQYLFTTSQFQQNSTDEDEVDATLTLNKAFILQTLKAAQTEELTSGTYGGVVLGTETDTDQTFGFRLLEIAAANVFGHCRARAAISNDESYQNLSIATTYSTYTGDLANVLTNQMSDAFNSEVDSVFNQYVDYVNNATYGVSFNANQVDVSQDFNFYGLKFQFLLQYYTDTISDSTGSALTDTSLPSNVNQTIRLTFYDYHA